MVFEGDELRAGHIVDGEGRAPLRGLQDDRHAAVRRELDVQAEDEVFGVTQRQGHTFRGICGDGVLRRMGATDEQGGGV